MMTEQEIAAVLGRHERIALQFSGGKDSTACLYLMRPWWDRVTVYWLNTGDAFPETVEAIERARAVVPRFIEIPGLLAETIAAHGYATDLTPATSTALARAANSGGAPLIDRFSCCYFSLMEPMMRRMLDDGITLIIRGQKDADAMRGPLRSGDSLPGMPEVLYPIEDWTDEDVLAFLRGKGIPLLRFYLEGMTTAPECMRCSAWWGDGRAAYLKRHHPQAYQDYQDRLGVIVHALLPHFDLLQREASCAEASEGE